MPSYRISEGIGNGHRSPAGLFEILFLEAVLTTGDETGATLELATSTMSLTGTGLVYGGAGETSLIAGTLDSFTYSFRPGYFFEFTDLDLGVADLAAAATAEVAGDLGAMETLLYALDWTVIDNSTSANVTDALTSADGIPIRFKGDNHVILNYGNDSFDLGAGKDVAHGKLGEDRIWGGTGNDRIFGGARNDTLYGEAGRDRLYGGKNDDTLDGGDGRDRIFGGDGDDRLSGGAGADLFVFVARPLLRQEDVILDFAAGIDTIRIRTDSTVTMADTATGLRLSAGDMHLDLAGVFEVDLAPDSVQIVPL